VNKFNQYITPDKTVSIDIELKSIIKKIAVSEFIKNYKISNLWRGKFFIKKIINKVFKYQLSTSMKWNQNFWDSITIRLIKTKLIIEEQNIDTIIKQKTTKKRFQDIKRYQKLMTKINLGEPLYITNKVLNIIGADIEDDKIFILDGSRRLVANILNNTNPDIILIDLKDSNIE